LAELSTHRAWTAEEAKIAKKADYFIIGGSNLLTNSLFPPSQTQWKFSLNEFRILRNKTILFGPGWQRNDSDITFFTSCLYALLMAKDSPQLVRDGVSRQKLLKTGREIINSSCPTLFRIQEVEENLNCVGNTTVVVTLSGNNKNVDQDKKILEIASSNYKKVKLFPQGVYDPKYPEYSDETYFRELGLNYEILEGSLEGFSHELKSGSHYFGTRLHGGIFAMQHGNPSSIIDIDTRARNIFIGSGYEVLQREKLVEGFQIDKSFRKPSFNQDIINQNLERIRQLLAGSARSLLADNPR
jgi:polysaccharide pyruvyl transferase WcaK-like protein